MVFFIVFLCFVRLRIVVNILKYTCVLGIVIVWCRWMDWMDECTNFVSTLVICLTTDRHRVFTLNANLKPRKLLFLRSVVAFDYTQLSWGQIAKSFKLLTKHEEQKIRQNKTTRAA